MKRIKIGICDFVDLDEVESTMRDCSGVTVNMKSGKRILVRRTDVIEKLIAELNRDSFSDCSGELEVDEIVEKIYLKERSKSISKIAKSITAVSTPDTNTSISELDIKNEFYVTDEAAKTILDKVARRMREDKEKSDAGKAHLSSAPWYATLGFAAEEAESGGK